MSVTAKNLDLDAMTVEERISLVTEIWNTITESGNPGLLTDTQRAELNRRVADHEANPDDVVSWEDAKAAALRRIGK